MYVRMYVCVLNSVDELLGCFYNREDPSHISSCPNPENYRRNIQSYGCRLHAVTGELYICMYVCMYDFKILNSSQTPHVSIRYIHT